MTINEAKQLRERGLHFFGRVTAGQTHELTNVLNIINELAGLQGDLLAAADLGRPLPTDKLEEITAKTHQQVRRGEQIIRNINRFAHSTDVELCVFDLKDVLASIAFLAERSARLKKVELLPLLPEETIVLETSPFLLQQAVFLGIELALLTPGTPPQVTVRYDLIDGGVEVAVASNGRFDPKLNVGETLNFLRLLIRDLGGTLRPLDAEAGPCRIAFHLPKSSPSTASDGID